VVARGRQQYVSSFDMFCLFRYVQKIWLQRQ